MRLLDIERDTMNDNTITEASPMLRDTNKSQSTTSVKSMQTTSEDSKSKTANLIALASIIPLLVPTFILWQYEQSRPSSDRTSSKTLVAVYFGTGIIGVLIAMIVQGVLGWPAALILFGSDAKKYLEELGKGESELKDPEHIATRWNMSRRWQYWVFMFFFAAVMAGLSEEVLKYCAIITAQHRGGVVSPRDCITVAVASGAGFATVESIGFVFAAWHHKEAGLKLVLTIAERSVFGVLGHSMMAALTGVGVMARDFLHEPKTVFQILWLPVLFHGSVDLMLFAISAYNGNIGWVHPRKGPTVYIMFGVALVHLSLLTTALWSQLRHYGFA